MLLLDDVKNAYPWMRHVFDDVRVFRVHPDVLDLAADLVEETDKLREAAPAIFMPAYLTWIEWEAPQGKLGFLFQGEGANSITEGAVTVARKLAHDSQPILLGGDIDIPNFKMSFVPGPSQGYLEKHGELHNARFQREYKERFGHAASGSLLNGPTLEMVIVGTAMFNKYVPLLWAVLALINSPKIVQHCEVDVSRLNKRRTALGRYTFHPYHEVRLNVDEKTGRSTSTYGDGPSKCLHFCKAHLRFIQTLRQFIRISPHWRGDPALGIRDTSYRVDRAYSRWLKDVEELVD